MSGKLIAILAAVVPLVIIVTYLGIRTGGHKKEEAEKAQGALPFLAEPHLAFDRAFEQSGNWLVPGPMSPFADRQHPKPPDEEVGSEGHYDFWFENKSDAPVEVVLTHVSCNRCVAVRMALAPEAWQAQQAAEAAGAAVLGPLGAAGEATHATPRNPVPGADVSWETLVVQEGRRDGKGFTVPAKRAGWVRLGWKEQQAGQQILSADVFTTCRTGDAPPIHFEVAALFIDPVRVLPEKNQQSIGTMVDGDAPRTVNFTVYSSTRDTFSLEPETEAVQQKEHPFVTCGRPVPLTPKECIELQKEHRTAFRCGYSVPVTVHERLKDGREHDLGPFRSGVALTSKDVLPDKTVGLWIGGTVRGQLTVIGGEGNVNQDRVALGAFPRSLGVRRTFTIEAQADTPLELDRVPAFMKVEEPRAEDSTGRRKTWSVTLSIAPNAVSGQFPNADDPLLRDTAIYLKAKGRGVRIPVSGMASQ